MKKSPFYFEIKDVLIQFISAFDDIVISRYNKDRAEQSQINVRYVYSYHPRVDMYAGHEMRTVSDHLPQPVPINIDVDVSVLTKYQTDMDQILSNFIPYNNPYIIISWKVPEELLQQSQEIRSEVLWSGNINVDYPTDINSSDAYRISSNTSFTIKGWLFRHKDDPIGNIFTINSFFTPVSGITGLT